MSLNESMINLLTNYTANGQDQYHTFTYISSNFLELILNGRSKRLAISFMGVDNDKIDFVIYFAVSLKVHLTPNFFFAKTNLLVIWNTSAKKFLDSVKSSIFCALTKSRK